MANRRKPAKKRKPNQIIVESKPSEPDTDAIARTVLRPTVQAAATLQVFSTSFGELDPMALVNSLNKQIESASKNDLGRCEAMLVAQAHTLDAIFHTMARRAANNLGHYPETVERYLKLALRAQSQVRATWETLSTIKNPPMVGYVKQANIAHGHQQVNNTPSVPNSTSRAGINPTLQNELLDAKDGERLDTGTTGAAGGANPTMETVGTVHGTKDGRR